MLRKIALTAALALVLIGAGLAGRGVATPPAPAPAPIAIPAPVDTRPVIRIEGHGDGGGSIEVYRTVLNFMRFLGARVELGAECTSACVMILRAIPEDRICVRPGARIGLHMVWKVGRNGKPQNDPKMTEQFVRMFYPPWIAAWIAAHGPLKSEPIYVEFAELKQHYRECA